MPRGGGQRRVDPGAGEVRLRRDRQRPGLGQRARRGDRRGAPRPQARARARTRCVRSRRRASLVADPSAPTPGIVLIGTRCRWSSPTGRGQVVLIPPDAGKRQGTRPGWDGGLYTFTRRVLATDRGGGPYAKREGMIEPIFADIHCDSRPAAHRGRCIWRIERLLAPGGQNSAARAVRGRAAAGVADQPPECPPASRAGRCR